MKLNISVFSGVGYGGASNLVLGLSRYLISRGHKVKLFLVLSKLKKDNPLLLKQVRKLGEKNVSIFPINEFRRFGIIGHYITLFRLLKTHKKMALLINKSEFNVVIATHCQYTQSPFLLHFLNKQLPLVFIFCESKREFYEQTSFDHFSFKKRLARGMMFLVKILDRYNLRKIRRLRSYKIISISRYARDQLKKIYKLDSEVVYPGVDTKSLRVKRKKYGVISQEPFFLSVGAFNFHKGFDFILEALSFLPGEMRNLTIIGNGGHDFEQIKRLAKRFQVNLKMKSFVSEKELIENYRRADLFLYAPRREPFGLAVFEAMSCGVPVVAVSEGGYSEILRKKGEQAFLASRQPKLFANKIIGILKSDQKYNARKNLARKIAVGLDWSLVGAQIEQVIKEVTR